jgi:excisionase family DNA binding protein
MTAAITAAPPAPGKQLYRVREAQHILSVSRSYLYEELRLGRLRSVHAGRSRLIPAAAIAEYVALLETEDACEGAR